MYQPFSITDFMQIDETHPFWMSLWLVDILIVQFAIFLARLSSLFRMEFIYEFMHKQIFKRIEMRWVY